MNETVNNQDNNYFSIIRRNKDLIGKVLFLISVIVLCYMFISPLSNVYINYDERFTINLINLSLNDAWNVIVHDVHPPLYYFIVMGIINLLNLCHIPLNIVYVCKVISIVPFILIMLVSITKIKKEYGWFTSGLFIYSITTMGHFFIQFLNIRMYSWSLFFFLLTFLYLGDIILKDKSWLYFTIFSVLCIYTHNIMLIFVGLLYLILLGYILFFYRKQGKQFCDFKTEVKKWFLSVIGLGILYIPWLLILIQQMGKQHSNGIELSLYSCIKCITGFSTMNLNTIEVLGSLIFLSAMLLLSFMIFKKNKSKHNYIVISGMLLFTLSFVLGFTLLPLVIGSLVPRYLIPIYAIFWLCVSILLGKLDNNKLLSLLFIIVILLSVMGIIGSIERSNTLYDEGVTEEQILKELNNENNVIIYNHRFHYYCYNYDLNNTDSYALKKMNIYYDTDYKVEKDIIKILKENPDKNVYTIKNINKKKDKNFGKNIIAEKVGNRGHTTFFKLKLNTTDNTT